MKKRWIRIRYIRNGRSSECRSRRSFIKFSWINKTFQQRENIAISKRKNTKANFLTVPFGTKFYYSLDSTQIHFANKNKIYNSEIQNTHSSYLKHTHTQTHRNNRFKVNFNELLFTWMLLLLLILLYLNKNPTTCYWVSPQARVSFHSLPMNNFLICSLIWFSLKKALLVFIMALCVDPHKISWRFSFFLLYENVKWIGMRIVQKEKE